MGNFCTQCGAPLESDAISFCTNCGAYVENNSSGIGKESVATSAASGNSVPAGYTMPASSLDGGATPIATSAAPVFQAAPPMQAVPTNAATAPVDQQQDSSVKTGVIVGVIAGVVLAFIIVMVAFHPWSDGNSGDSVTTTLGSSEESGDEESGSDSESSATSEADDTDYYDDLMSYYGAMPGYDQEIADCATYFNNNYTKSDYSVRESGANNAADIHRRVSSDLDNLESLDVPSSNPYYSDWQNMVELQTDLLHRIDVIDQAWQNSLSYSNPADHVDAIIAPLAADNVDGVNKYKTHYVDNYSAWAPSEK